LSEFRSFVVALLLISMAGCSSVTRAPGPEAQEAAKRLSSDIVSYRNGVEAVKRRQDASVLVRGANLFAQVYEKVRVHYVRDIDDDALIAAATKEIRKRHPEPQDAEDKELVEAAIHGMLGSLDNYSSYLDKKHLKALREQTRGRFGGLGIEVRKGDTYIDIVAPIDGTPAERAGLKSGDHIVRADGKSLKDALLRDAVLLLRGVPGSDVTLSIKRDKKTPFDVTITRAIINVASVRWRAEGDVGYLRITSFSERVGEEVASAVMSLKTAIGRRMRGIVLDLRNNPGGLLDQSIEVSDVFLDEGRIVSTRERHFEQHYSATKGDLTGGVPIVVLINNGSASAAEIVAGALRDHHRATLIGTRSFGKGTVQTILPLSSTDAVKLTTAIYLTPSGTSVEGGIVPDHTVKLDEEREGDEQLERALQLLSAQTVSAPTGVISR
jgi:carboxyl-terminal processing protease